MVYINDFTDAYLALINWPILNSDDENGTRADFFLYIFSKNQYSVYICVLY